MLIMSSQEIQAKSKRKGVRPLSRFGVLRYLIACALRKEIPIVRWVVWSGEQLIRRAQ